MPKRWPTDPSFRAFKAPKSAFLKADCSGVGFQKCASEAGSTFLQKYENKMHQSKTNIKMHLANYIFDANAQHDLKNS